MQFNLTLTGDVTPDNAPFFALLFGGAPTPVQEKAPAMREPITPAPAPDPEPSALTDEQLATKIRAKGRDLKVAGQGGIVRKALQSVGCEKFSEVPSEKYAALWEVLKDAG